MSKKLSVIIPSFNVVDYIEECVRSAISDHVEVIVVDDGSTDGTAELLESRFGQDPSVVLVLKENGGVSSARNAGLERATGSYIAFLDGDLYCLRQWIPSYIGQTFL